jgi:hypothetical protein
MIKVRVETYPAGMPRYFFHVHDGQEMPDREGVELPGLDEARMQAITTAGEIIRQHPDVIWNAGEWQMDVTDETGAPVFTLRFSAEDRQQRSHAA